MEKLPLLILLVIGAVLIFTGLRSMRVGRLAQVDERRLAAEGVDGQARVTKKRDIHPRRSAPGFFIAYAFTAGAQQTVEGQAEVSQADYTQLNVGDAVAIRYVPGDPKNSRLPMSITPRATAVFATDGVSGLIIGVVMILIGLIFFR